MNEFKTFLLACMVLSFISLASATVTLNTPGSCLVNGTTIVQDWCFQETANSPTSCGGLSSGSYSDLGFGYSVSYTKPSTAINNTLFQYRFGYGGMVNASIPKSCWDYGSSLTFRLVSSITNHTFIPRLTNSDFNVTANWTPSADFTLFAVGYHSPPYCMSVDELVTSTINQSIRITGGVAYNLSGWWNSNGQTPCGTGRSTTTYLNVTTNTGASCQTGPGSIGSADGWNYTSCVFTAASGDTTANVKVYHLGGASGKCDILWDDILLTQSVVTQNHTVSGSVSCFNGTAWISFVSLSSTESNVGVIGSGSLSNGYDGDWDSNFVFRNYSGLGYGSCSSGVCLNISAYEEGVFWLLQSPVLSYNVVFRQENNGNNYNFNLQNQSFLQVVCVNYGSDLIGPLSDANYVFSTREVPMTMVVRLNNSNGSMLRSQVVTVSSSNISFFLPQPSDVPLEFHLFHLSDYTKRFSTSGSSLFVLKRNVNNTKEIVNSQYFDGEQNANVYIYADVPYEISIYSPTGDTRNYGFQMFNSLQVYPYVHSIDVVDVNLGVKDRYLFGSNLAVSFGWDYDSQTVSLSYNKTGSQIDSITWRVYAGNQTPYYYIYNTSVYNTQSGILQYTIPNLSWPYRMTADIVNDGISIPTLSRTVVLYNSSALQVDLHLPSELWGVSRTMFYNIIAFFILMCAGFAGTQVDAGKTGVAVTGLACLFVVFGWLSYVPLWMCTLAFLFSIMYELTKRRSVD